MRAWRKVYAKLLDSEQIAQLSDGATTLLVLLIVAQDDTGYYPWTDVKVRRLTASRPRWSRNEIDTWRDELVTAGIARLEDGGIVLLKGQALNGVPRQDIKAELYPRNESVTPRNDSVTARNESVTLEQSRVEQSRADSPPVIPPRGDSPTEKLGGKSQGAFHESEVMHVPEWFEPLTQLEGYKPGRHLKAMQVIVAACEYREVETSEVIAMFCDYWPIGRLKHAGWKTPVGALTKTIEIQIAKVLEKRDGRRRIPPTQAAETDLERIRSAAQLDAQRSANSRRGILPGVSVPSPGLPEGRPASPT